MVELLELSTCLHSILFILQVIHLFDLNCIIIYIISKYTIIMNINIVKFKIDAHFD